jgi:uncharacterized membrane protein YqaE (UPF0057 family)
MQSLTTAQAVGDVLPVSVAPVIIVEKHPNGLVLFRLPPKFGPDSVFLLTCARQKVSMDLLRIIIAILLPLLGVFLQVGIGKHFWINILLTILGFVPGIIHAVWVIAKY